MITNFPDKKPYNLGGYVSFQFAPYQSIDTWPDVVAGITTGAVTFKAGYGWLTGYATKETLLLTEDPALDDGGTVYNTAVEAFAPGDLPALTGLVAQMARARFAVLLKDRDGVLRLVGSQDCPLDFTAAYGSGAAASELKGYKMRFAGVTDARAPVYTG